MYSTKSSLEVAVEAAARVDAVLAKKGRIKPNAVTGVLTGKGSVKAAADLFSTEFEINDVPLSARNLLTKGITQEEINHFSGALISTRGRYIHPDDKGKICEPPLYLYIQGPNKQSLDLAIQRIDSLIKEAMEHEMMKVRSNQPPPPGQSMMGGMPQHTHMPAAMSMPGIEKVLVGLDHAPLSFDARNKVLGPGGANLQYISNETGTIVTLRGRGSGFPEPNTGQESPEPLHLCVEHSKPEVLQQGRQLAFNLVETIQQEFAALHNQQVMPPPSILVPQGYQVNVSQQGTNVAGGGGILTVHQPHDQNMHNSNSVGGPPGAPGVVATSITVPIFTQQHAGQIVTVPPPSLGVPPPQIMHQPPPPQVQLPPPGLHIPAQQGPLVPPSSNVQQQHHQLLVQQQPPPPPPQQHQQVATSQAAAVHLQLQQHQAAIAASQGQVQVSATLSQPPPTFTHPHPQMMTSTATQVINGIANQHSQQQQLPPQQQQQQAIITQTSYPVQYIQANGQTIMAYPAGTIRPEQLAAAQQPGAQTVTNQQQLTHIPTQLQPGQQIVLQPAVAGQPQIQLAQLMQNQTIQQHLLHQAQQGQPGTVMLLQYPPQSPQQPGHIATTAQAPPPPVVSSDHNHGGNTIVRMPVVRMTVPIQSGPGDVMTAQTQLAQLTATSGASQTMSMQQLQYSQQGKIVQQIQPQQVQQPPHMQSPPQQQLQMQIQPPHQIHPHQMQLSLHQHQQIQPPPPQQSPLQVQQQIQHQQTNIVRQQQVKSNQEMSPPSENVSQQIGQKRRYPNSNNANSNQQLYQQAPQPVPPPLHQHSGNASMKQQQVKQQHIQQRQGIGNVQHQQQSQQQQQPSQQDSSGGQVQGNVSGGQSTQGQDRPGIGQQQRVEKDALPPAPSSVASDDWPQVSQQSPDQNHHQMPNNSMGNQDENKQPDIKRSRLGNGGEHQGQHQAQTRDRPTFNHYSSKPQMYNSQLPFHMHQLGMYPLPPPPPPPPPPMDSPVGQFGPYYQQPHPQSQPQFNPPPGAPNPGGYTPYCLPPQ